jgi:hypothetical protein
MALVWPEREIVAGSRVGPEEKLGPDGQDLVYEQGVRCEEVVGQLVEGFGRYDDSVRSHESLLGY